MERGAVDRDRPHAPVVAVRVRRDRDDVVDARRGAAAQRRGQRIGTEVDRQLERLSSSTSSRERQHRVGGGDVIGTRVERSPAPGRGTRPRAGGPGRRGATPSSPTRSTSALTPSVSAASTAPLPSPASAAAGGNDSATFQPDLTSRSASPPRTNGHWPGNGGSGSASSAVYSGRIGKAVVGRRIEQPLGLGAQVGRIATGALGQHSRPLRDRHSRVDCSLYTPRPASHCCALSTDTAIRLNDRVTSAADAVGLIARDHRPQRPRRMCVACAFARRAPLATHRSRAGESVAIADRDCDSRRSRAAGAAADRGAAPRLGDVGRAVVPAGVPRRARRRDGLPVPAHRVHAGRGPAVRPLARRRARRDGQHGQRA